ncbi:glycosyltransferase family A protein [Chitinophaga sp. YIM B06452]|uniref:glycosyltransferase family 2 protein n=1 Tax=Chitinophaga sp. YIM B06452 TaxID=3082158 RepID=UPI0031FE95B5
MISVIIPTFRRVDSLLKTLESLNHQTSKNFEVIVVNDDPSRPLVLDESIYTYPVRTINNDVNMGVGFSRNKGVQQSRFNWISFLDDDDFYRNDKIEVLSGIIANETDIDFIYHPIHYEYPNEGVSYYTRPMKNISLNDILITNVLGGTPSYTFRKALYQEIGGFDTNLVALEDYDLAIRIIKSGTHIKYLDEPLSHCMAITKSEGLSKDVKKAYRAFEQLEEKHAGDFAGLPPHKKKEREAAKNSLIAFTFLLNLNRKLSKFYLRAFLWSFKSRYLLAAIIGFVDPKLLIIIKGKRVKKELKSI